MLNLSNNEIDEIVGIDHLDQLVFLDLSNNKMGWACCLAIAENMIVNRSLKRLNIGKNNLASSGTHKVRNAYPVESFYRFLCMNYSLRTLILAGNRLGHAWGLKIAEGLARNSTLSQVDLRDTRISPEAGRALTDVFVHKGSLVELGLSMDEIGIATFSDLRRAFQSKKAFKLPTDMDVETRITEERHGHDLKTYDHHNEQQDFSHEEKDPHAS